MMFPFHDRQRGLGLGQILLFLKKKKQKDFAHGGG
jgi:hypothetical protein